MPRQNIRQAILSLTNHLCWFCGRLEATHWTDKRTRAHSVELGPIPTCQHCFRQKTTQTLRTSASGPIGLSLDQFREWLEEGPFWGEREGLTLPLASHLNKE